MRVAVAVADPIDAVIVTAVVAETLAVETLNVPVVDPAATVMVAGTVVEESELVRLTTWPPVGAAEERVTVPVVEPPPSIAVAPRVSDLKPAVYENFDTNPAQLIGPQPESVSHPTVATELEPFGRTPFVPDLTS